MIVCGSVLLDRIEAKIQRVPFSGCWIWIGAICRNGYGKVHTRPTNTTAHRHVYKAFKWDIPTGLTLDHLCRVRCCVNPDHLEPVTLSENLRRRPLEKCPYGHQYTDENTKREKSGARSCRKCRALREQARRANARIEQ